MHHPAMPHKTDPPKNGVHKPAKKEQDELRRIVGDLVAEEIMKIREKQRKGLPKLSDKFVENVSLMGLTDSIKSKHRCVKILWTLIFLAGLGATSFFVYRIMDEYRRDPTATKVAVVRSHNYSFPSVVLCLDTWLNARKAFDMGFSKESIAYALRYLMLFEEVGGKVKPSTNWRNAQREFYRVYKRHNFSTLVDFFKHVAVDIVSESLNKSDVSYTCFGCEKRYNLEKVLMNRGICHRVVISEVDGKLRQSHGLAEFRFRVPDLSAGLVPTKGYWRLFVNPLVKQPISSSPFMSIYGRHSHAIKISSARFDMVPKTKDPCIENDPTARLDDPTTDTYSSLSCSLTCVSKSYRRLYGCTVLNLDTNFTQPLTEFCNTYYWKKWPGYRVNFDEEKESMTKCIDQCPHECSVMMYNTMVDMHESKELVAEELDWKNDAANQGTSMRNAKLYFINAAVLSGGEVTYQEVFTYSFETLVGNIGGTCGIWIGVSIMTLIQLFMFFLEQTLLKGAKARLKLYHAKFREQHRKESAEDSALM